MNNLCTVYCDSSVIDRVPVLIQQYFPKAKWQVEENEAHSVFTFAQKHGFFKGKSNFKISVRERNADLSLEKDTSLLATNLKGMLGYISTFPVKYPAAVDQLQETIPRMVSEVAILADVENSSALKQLVDMLTTATDGFVFAQQKGFVGVAEYPHFLNGDYKVILDVHGASEIHKDLGVFVALDSQPEITLLPDQIARKQRNIAYIKKLGLKTIDHLPAVESETEVQLRSAEEIAYRAICLAIINLVAFDSITGDRALQMIREYNLEGKITPDELTFLNKPTAQAKTQMTWRCEGIWTLCWALGIVEELGDANQLADLNKIPQEAYPIVPKRHPDTFVQKHTTVRSAKEILDQNDLYYRLNWACVDARINNKTISEVNPSLCYERQYALNWLITYMDLGWDDVSCDT
ncbi:DUF4272 domain-containing protein [Flavobacterium sp. ASW18X]|uniref:DUF4272 domain-containing protein n=1 Tax=Flavobacterium sp. ASW18X TaxID=2572595 RepID=UPI0010AEB260|nr:DUF4272 domain-containing protein [Flavobacterium sp. ASW18X]TKD58973.1 DUF4272 domain-containing protein [Flavobacterium sp. ASW18X]